MRCFAFVDSLLDCHQEQRRKAFNSEFEFEVTSEETNDDIVSLNNKQQEQEMTRYSEWELAK